MTGPSSQNAPARHPSPQPPGSRHALIPLLLAFAILVAAAMAVSYFPDSELGQVLNHHLSQLADPHAWIP